MLNDHKRAGLPEVGFVRLPAIIAPKGLIPVSRATWYAGVKEVRFPSR